jgi:hypothetical protein
MSGHFFMNGSFHPRISSPFMRNGSRINFTLYFEVPDNIVVSQVAGNRLNGLYVTRNKILNFQNNFNHEIYDNKSYLTNLGRVNFQELTYSLEDYPVSRYNSSFVAPGIRIVSFERNDDDDDDSGSDDSDFESYSDDEVDEIMNYNPSHSIGIHIADTFPFALSSNPHWNCWCMDEDDYDYVRRHDPSHINRY